MTTRFGTLRARLGRPRIRWRKACSSGSAGTDAAGADHEQEDAEPEREGPGDDRVPAVRPAPDVHEARAQPGGAAALNTLPGERQHEQWQRHPEGIDGEQDAAIDGVRADRGDREHRAEDGAGADAGHPVRGAEQVDGDAAAGILRIPPPRLGNWMPRICTRPSAITTECRDGHEHPLVGQQERSDRPGEDAERNEGGHEAEVEQPGARDQRGRIGEGVGEERGEQHDRARAEQAEHTAEERAEVADVHQ